MSENVIFQCKSVLVSGSRFCVDGETHSIRNISAIRTGKTSRFFHGLVAIFLGWLTYQDYALFATMLFFLGSWLVWFGTRHNIFISSSSGEVRALSTSDEDLFNDVVKALNKAIAQA